ncbi:hypothetical protein EDB84DRAFT_1559931 [Lactarius hengduanensis]|nr:hypothetical protein EDB84DRAFT_1559931 [Lactarius hengduanensis]
MAKYDTHGVKYRPFCGRLIRQEGLPYARHLALAKPVWGELLLLVRKNERSFRMRLTLLDWDKLSFNDFAGDDLAANVPKKDPNMGFYPEEEDGPRTFQQFNSKGLKRTPTIAFRVRRAKYQLYDALR